MDTDTRMRARGHVARLVEAVRSLPPLVTDGILAVALLTLGLAGLQAPIVFDQPYRDSDAAGLTLIAAQTLPLVWRRSRPGVVLAVTGVATSVYLVALYVPTNATLGVLVAVYTFAAHAERHRMLAAGLTFVGLSVVHIGGMVYAERVELTVEAVVAGYFVFAAAWLLGDNMRRRREQNTELEQRAARLELERDERARRAAEEERARIARELHDVVAHSVSVMVVQAGAARRLVERDPPEGTAALRAIEEAGRQALTDMRRLLGVLRPEGHTNREPQPTLAGVEALAASVREAGLPVDVSVEGEPVRLPAGIELTAYRVIQEALTNSLKHAGQASARVAVRYVPGAVEIEVADDGRGAASSLAHRDGTGHGLVGMRERVSLYGGNLEAGPAPSGGFRVAARIPVGTDT
jgi:signal transduction histidine kinase